MSYVQRVLQPGETVQFRGGIHWVVFVRGIVLVLISAAAGAATLIYGNQPALTAVIAGSGVWGTMSLIAAWFRRWTTEIAVTSHRIIFKEGFISRRTVEMNMDKVESVDVNQSVLGRMLDYGDVLVRGTGAGLEPLTLIQAPIEFRNRVIVR